MSDARKFKFILPESAYKCEGLEVVGGHAFKDGELVVNEDLARLMAPKLTRFYGVSVEEIFEEVEEDLDPNADSSLQTTVTKA